jgi:cold-inducible RNA-binding protein
MPRLFIGNIPHSSSEAEIQAWIESRGFRVESVEIIYDRLTGKPRGFAFVSLGAEVNGASAIDVLNGQRMLRRVLTVNAATPLINPLPHDPADSRNRVAPG